MGTVRKFLWLALLVGCNDDTGPDTTGDDSGTGPKGPLGPFNFVSAVSAVDYESSVNEDSLAAHRASTMLLASTAIVAADEKAQDRLNTDGGGGAGLRAAAIQCWTRPEFPMFSFTIDYSGCANYLMDGGVELADHPSGPLLYSYSNFAIAEREMGGTLAFDTRDAFGAPLYWQVYNTSASNPGVDNPVPVGITINQKPYGISYTGGATVNFLGATWSMWGVMTFGSGENAIEVVHGAADAADVAPDEPTGPDVLTSSLNWLTCRCPTSGIQAQDMGLHFEHVTLDIDDLQDEDDGFDDVTIEIDVDFSTSGRLVLEHNGCGTYNADFTGDPIEIPVTSDQLEGAISFKCSTFEIADEERCQALLTAASRTTDLVVTVSSEELASTASDAVESDFDTTWCAIQ